MKASVYIDKGKPVAYVSAATLSDGSKAWNLHFRGGAEAHEIIPCISEKAADKAFELIVEALTVAVGERPLVL